MPSPEITLRIARGQLDPATLAALKRTLPPTAEERPVQKLDEVTAEIRISDERPPWRHDTPHTAFVLPVEHRDRATLTVLAGPNAGASFGLHEEEEIVIGREESAGICLDDPSVSRRHARIVRDGEGYAIEDLRSTNGTFVAASRVERAVLASGDRIQVGSNCVLRFAFVDETEESLQRRLYESSTRDALTGVFNRKCLFERLKAEVAHARRADEPLSLLMLDVDHFKKVNDLYGHAAGDHVLRSVAQCASNTVRAGDVFARYGGEEFATIARNAHLEEAIALAERLRRAVAAMRLEVGNGSIGVTVSIGVVALDECDPALDERELVTIADARLYGAKIQGRNRVCSLG
jgi:diguanylate cyclase (GGDEF)-like protein